MEINEIGKEEEMEKQKQNSSHRIKEEVGKKGSVPMAGCSAMHECLSQFFYPNATTQTETTFDSIRQDKVR